MAGLETAALVDGDVDENGAFLHAFQHFAGDEFRGVCAGDQHRADDDIRAVGFLVERLIG